ncbi:Ribosome-associated, YjgA [Sesbania bispinosa]|nr:Ribosome-associated, YjgA [Sesbania bispinosa]
MSQQVLRPLRQWPWLHHRGCASIELHQHLLTSPPEPTKSRLLAPLASSRRNLRFANVPLPTTELDDPEPKKSRNELKREAKRAVKWGMDLASFSAPQIKRILRVASLDQVVFEALMLVKRLGPDVREGRRRQFNYIDMSPSRLNTTPLSFFPYSHIRESDWHDSQVTRWFDGLINKDIQITNEVYSVQGVEFDRQELRKLVRRVHFAQEKKADNEEDEKKIETAAIGAKKALTRFLRGLSKRIPNG